MRMLTTVHHLIKGGAVNMSGKKQPKNVIERIVLGIITLLIFSLFSSIPLYYYITEYASSDSTTDTTEDSQISINFTTIYTTCNGSTKVISVCDIYGIADTLSGCSSSDGCNAETYTGSICIESLLAWQECAITGMDGTPFISVSKEQAELENDAETFESYLDLASKECQFAVLPFICLYTFPICDCATTRLYQPTRESCELIRDETCSSEWILVNSINPDLLPDCSNLPNAGPAETADESLSDCFNETNETDLQSTQNFTCRYDFIEQNNTCWPRCDLFSQFPEIITNVLKYTIIVTTSLGILLAFAVIIFGALDYKKVFVFPVIYVMFLIFDYLILALFSFASVIGGPELYCKDVRLDENYKNPTFFCILTGAVVHYVLPQTAVWWFCHITIFFFNVVFPFKSRNLKNTQKMKMIYAFSVLTGVLVPLPAMIACLIDDDNYGYVQNDFPTTFCTSKDFKLWFYSYVLPVNILLAVGSVLLFMIIGTIHKHQGFFKAKQRLTFIRVTTAEKKLLFLSLFFICFGVISGIFTVVTAAYRKELATAFQKYFACEGQGHIPGRCDRSEIEFVYLSYLGILTFISFGLLPGFAIFFVLNWKKLKCCARAQSVTSRQSSTTMSNIRMSTRLRPSIGRKVSKMSNLSFNAMYSISEEPTVTEKKVEMTSVSVE